jgi:ribonuclease HI
VKLNCYGGFQATEMKGSTGAVLRDSDGSFMAAAARWLPSASSALVTEAEACRNGLRMTLNMGEFRNVIMETDSVQLVSLWNSRQQQLSKIDVILQDIEDMVQAFYSFHFAHVKRSANSVAHLCAKQVTQSRPSLLWQDYPPRFLLSSLQSDCNLLAE